MSEFKEVPPIQVSHLRADVMHQVNKEVDQENFETLQHPSLQCMLAGFIHGLLLCGVSEEEVVETSKDTLLKVWTRLEEVT